MDARLRGAAVWDSGVSGSFGLASILPDPRNAARGGRRAPPGEAERVVTDFNAAVADSLFDPAAYEPYAGFLKRLLTPGPVPTVADLLRYPGWRKCYFRDPRSARPAVDARRLRPDGRCV